MLPKHAIVPMRLSDRSFWQPHFSLPEETQIARQNQLGFHTTEKARRRIVFVGPRKLGWLPLHQTRDINAQFASHGLFNRLERQCMILMACHSGNGQGAHHARTLYAQGEATARWRIIFI